MLTPLPFRSLDGGPEEQQVGLMSWLRSATHVLRADVEVFTVSDLSCLERIHEDSRAPL